MLHDPSMYPDPVEFNPNRFLPGGSNPVPTDPCNICFGFGRRIMNLAHYIPTGVHLADASVWICAAMSLAVFEISKAVENGVEITLEVDPSSAIQMFPQGSVCEGC
ncbi:hypothetical protein EDC04DRAFT_2733159 [Pisolithus marmoratus]|nr:hypothetical protein EDC04DRAFT_2733159 [Pisolithus marmoratus]